jgi:hypothetical protein
MAEMFCHDYFFERNSGGYQDSSVMNGLRGKMQFKG